MTEADFDKLSDKEKHHEATKALAWFCVSTTINPFHQSPENETDIIKIIVGKYMNGELKEVRK